MERRFSFSSGVVGLAVRIKEKQAVVADGNGTISCIAVKVRTLLRYYYHFFSLCLLSSDTKRGLYAMMMLSVVCLLNLQHSSCHKGCPICFLSMKNSPLWNVWLLWWHTPMPTIFLLLYTNAKQISMKFAGVNHCHQTDEPVGYILGEIVPWTIEQDTREYVNRCKTGAAT